MQRLRSLDAAPACSNEPAREIGRGEHMNEESYHQIHYLFRDGTSAVNNNRQQEQEKKTRVLLRMLVSLFYIETISLRSACVTVTSLIPLIDPYL
jgi:hypothetical protein